MVQKSYMTAPCLDGGCPPEPSSAAPVPASGDMGMTGQPAVTRGDIHLARTNSGRLAMRLYSVFCLYSSIRAEPVVTATSHAYKGGTRAMQRQNRRWRSKQGIRLKS